MLASREVISSSVLVVLVVVLAGSWDRELDAESRLGIFNGGDNPDLGGEGTGTAAALAVSARETGSKLATISLTVGLGLLMLTLIGCCLSGFVL